MRKISVAWYKFLGARIASAGTDDGGCVTVGTTPDCSGAGGHNPYALNFTHAAAALLRKHGARRARSHCRLALLLIHFTLDSLRESVLVFLKRQCDRTLGGWRFLEPLGQGISYCSSRWFPRQFVF